MIDYGRWVTTECTMTAGAALRAAQAIGLESRRIRSTALLEHAEGVMRDHDEDVARLEYRMGSDQLLAQSEEMMETAKALFKVALLESQASIFYAPASDDLDIDLALAAKLETDFNPAVDPCPDLLDLAARYHREAVAARLEGFTVPPCGPDCPSCLIEPGGPALPPDPFT